MAILPYVVGGPMVVVVEVSVKEIFLLPKFLSALSLFFYLFFFFLSELLGNFFFLFFVFFWF
jgi:hypothetical protein